MLSLLPDRTQYKATVSEQADTCTVNQKFQSVDQSAPEIDLFIRGNLVYDDIAKKWKKKDYSVNGAGCRSNNT